MARDRVEGAVVNINKSQLLRLTGLNQVLWINLMGKTQALHELAVYFMSSQELWVLCWFSWPFFIKWVVRSDPCFKFSVCRQFALHYTQICSIITDHPEHVSPSFPWCLLISDQFKFRVRAVKRGQLFLIRKPPLSISFIYSKKLIKENPPHLSSSDSMWAH